MIKYLLFAVLFILGGYGLIEAWPLIAGPTIFIASPLDHASFQGGMVDVVGKSARAATLTLNGAPLLRDREGNFSLTLTFPRGGSILTFEARDRFGRTVTETRALFVPNPNNQQQPPSR